MDINIKELKITKEALARDKKLNRKWVLKQCKSNAKLLDILNVCIDNEIYGCDIRASKPYMIIRDAAKFILENNIDYRDLTLRDLLMLNTFICAEVSLNSYVNKLSRRQLDLVEKDVRFLAKPVGDYDLYSLTDLELDEYGRGWFRQVIIDDDKQSVEHKAYLEKTVDEPLFKTVEVSCRRMSL